MRIHVPDGKLRIGVALVSRETIPVDGETIPSGCLSSVFGDSQQPVVMHYPKHDLGVRVSLVGRKTQPTHGFGIILGEALFAVRIPKP